MHMSAAACAYAQGILMSDGVCVKLAGDHMALLTPASSEVVNSMSNCISPCTQEQDAWRAAAGGKLYLAYGTYRRPGSSAMAVAELVYATARECGLAIK
jgi:hypothetical protein